MAERPPTGPEAYTAAVGLLEQALTVSTSPGERDSLIAAAQVYATLAGVAATMEPAAVRGEAGMEWINIVWPKHAR